MTLTARAFTHSDADSLSRKAARHSGSPAAAYAARGYLLSRGCYSVPAGWRAPDGSTWVINVDDQAGEARVRRVR